MKYFTKFLCLFLGAAMMLTMAACGSKSGTDANAGADGEKKQLVVATSPDFPPFEFLDGSQIVGMKNILPAIGNEMIALLKETAVAGYVAVQDLTRAGNLIRNNTYDAFNPLLLVAVVYLLLVIGMTQLLGLLERRLRRSDQH